MAERNTAAAQAALLLILQIWESLINGKYMKEACQYNKEGCPTCKSPRDCNNYFCLECKTAGLCPIVFRGDHEHRHHPWLQVRHYTRHYSVLSTDLAHFINKEGLKHIHTIADKKKTGQRHCNLTSKNGASSSRARATGNKSCRGCMASIRGSQNSTETFLVCSLQCLVKFARQRSEWDLLAMKDDAMRPMKPPLTFTEKLSIGGRMLDTPAATPIDAAPPSPQAAGDSPMLESHEAATATPIDEAPPSPQAAGDSPMLEFHEIATESKPVVEALPLPHATGADFPTSETHEDLSEESTLKALLRPFRQILTEDDSSMFVSPLEASLSEALSLPDFSVFEYLAAPAEPSELETHAPLPEIQGFDDIDLEWDPIVMLI